MYGLGIYYDAIEKYYARARHYYLMGVDKGNTTPLRGECMYQLALYYENIAHDETNLVALVIPPVVNVVDDIIIIIKNNKNDPIYYS